MAASRALLGANQRVPFLQKLQGKALPPQKPAAPLSAQKQGAPAPQGQRRGAEGQKRDKTEEMKTEVQSSASVFLLYNKKLNIN